VAPRTHRGKGVPELREEEHRLDLLARMTADANEMARALDRITKVRRARTARKIAQKTLQVVSDHERSG
jgi:hypothetical protein